MSINITNNINNSHTASNLVFQSYQDDGRKAVCTGTPFTVKKILPRTEIELGPVDQYASA